jgi:hypothetical protein
MRILLYYVAQPTFEKRMLNIANSLYKEQNCQHVSAFNDTDSTKGYGYGYGYGQTVKQNHGIKSDLKYS